MRLFVLKAEEAFATDMLRFAARKYGVCGMDGGKVMVTHITDPARWVDFYHDCASKSDPTEEFLRTWINADGWSFSWEEKLGESWVPLRDPARRRQKAEQLLENSDPALIDTAVQYDSVIFINDDLANWHSKLHRKEDYLLYLITHECLDLVGDRTERPMTQHGIPRWMDSETVKTLQEFMQQLGETNFRQRYL